MQHLVRVWTTCLDQVRCYAASGQGLNYLPRSSPLICSISGQGLNYLPRSSPLLCSIWSGSQLFAWIKSVVMQHLVRVTICLDEVRCYAASCQGLNYCLDQVHCYAASGQGYYLPSLSPLLCSIRSGSQLFAWIKSIVMQHLVRVSTICLDQVRCYAASGQGYYLPRSSPLLCSIWSGFELLPRSSPLLCSIWSGSQLFA